MCILNSKLYNETQFQKGYSKIATKLLKSDSPDIIKVLNNQNVLGVVEYTSKESKIKHKLNANIPFFTIFMESYMNESSFVEIWISNLEVEYGSVYNLKYALDGENLFVAITEQEFNVNLDVLGERIYDKIFSIINRLGYNYLYRMWNFFPKINENDITGIERYKSFCKGRSISFFKNFSSSTVNFLPAATGIGSNSGDVNICFISSAIPMTTHMENPRQTSAYHYPKKYGEKSPSFARATYCNRADSNFDIYVSGTASILGHDTVFVDDVEKQCITALDNIEVLISKDNLEKYNIKSDLTLKDLECIKVYIRNQKDYPIIKKICSEKFSANASIIYIKADICRKDLLLEIEGIIKK